ncbi:MAG TPA: hypothetical protein VK557_01475 [Pyrinomonadaceae bacterium]|nr:hypothetical protein [Pyrinomonadaceae bacterium]
MIENHKQDFSDETIRSFLLGELTGGDQSRFEEQLFMDEELAARVRLAELELCDDYASTRVSNHEQQVFRERFLLTLDRKQALAVSTALGDRFRTKATEHSVMQRIRNLININQAVWKYAFAGLILIIVLATALLVTKDRSHIAFPFIPKRLAPKPTATTTPQFSNHSHSAAAPSHNEQSPELPLHDSLTPSVVLTSNTPIDSSPVITNANRDVVRFEIVLDQPAVEFYDVNVTTLSGESVFSANAIKRAEDKLVLDIPANAISPGDYQVSLTRNDEARQSAGTYYFRVR